MNQQRETAGCDPAVPTVAIMETIDPLIIACERGARQEGETMAAPSNSTPITRTAAEDWPDLLAHLHRGGTWGYWWTMPGKKSHWWRVGQPAPIPRAANVWFGVHPMAQRALGNERAKNTTVAAVNCVFADFDAKHYGHDKTGALAAVHALPLAPSAIIDSGGGYHLYWLLVDPFILTTAKNRERAKRLQREWVHLVGGDGGAKDLARILRPPGTINRKTEYLPAGRPVTLLECHLDRLYTLAEMEALLPAEPPVVAPNKPTNGTGHTMTRPADDVERARAALDRLAPWRRDDYDSWVEVGMTLSEMGPTGLALWRQWSRDSNKYRDGDCDEKWRTFTPGDGLTLGSLFHWANEDDPRGISGNGHSEAAMMTPRTTSRDSEERSTHYKSAMQRRIGERLPKEQAERIRSIEAPCPDPEMRERIFRILTAAEAPERQKPSPTFRRRWAAEALLPWLAEHGGFVQSNAGDLFYFFEPDRKLFNLEQDMWGAWLYAVTGANPAGTDFAYLAADCKSAALAAPRRHITRFAAWDDGDQVLRVSRFDGTVYRIDGDTITEEPNGAAVLFEDDMLCEPYLPDFEAMQGRELRWLTEEIPSFESDRGMYGLALRAWVAATFFTELCPTRPLLVLVGEKGSGKSMVLRLLLRLITGPLGELSGVPDKPDGFTAAAAAAHLLCIDNLDEYTGWLRDKLARLATGGIDEYRKLYTSKELGRIRYRCWLAFTARTPDTLRRDDLADRLLLIPTERIAAGNVQAEREFQKQAALFRDAWWGDMLTTLNRIVAAIRRGDLETRSALRLADWESLGRVVARTEGAEPTWDRFVATLQKAQSTFLLQDDLIVDGLETWLKTPANRGREVTTRDLYDELQAVLFEDKKPPREWPGHVRAFGKRLASIRRELGSLFTVKWEKDRKTTKVLYTFDVKAD